MGSNLEMSEQGHQNSRAAAAAAGMVQQHQQQTSSLTKTLLWIERRISFVPKLPNKTGGNPAGGLVREYGLVAPITFAAILAWGGKLTADWLAYLALVDVNFAYRINRWQLAQTSSMTSSSTSQWNLSVFYANVTTILFAFCVAESCVIFVEVVRLFIALRWQKTSFLRRRDGLSNQEDYASVSYAAYTILLCHTVFGDLPIALIWYLLERGICCSFLVYFRNVQTLWSLALCLVSGSLKLALIILGYPGQRRVKKRRMVALKVTSAHLVCASLVLSSIGLVLHSSTSPVTNDATSTFAKTRVDFGLTQSFISIRQLSSQQSYNGTITMGSIFDSAAYNSNAATSNNATIRNLSHSLHITQMLNIFINANEIYLSSNINCMRVPIEYFPHLMNATSVNISANDVISCTCRFYFIFSPSDSTLYYYSAYRLVTNSSCVSGKFYPSVNSKPSGNSDLTFSTFATDQWESSSTASSTNQQPEYESSLYDWISTVPISTNEKSEWTTWWDLSGTSVTYQQSQSSATTNQQPSLTVGMSTSINQQSDSTAWVPLLQIAPSFPCNITIAQLPVYNASHTLLTCTGTI